MQTKFDLLVKKKHIFCWSVNFMLEDDSKSDFMYATQLAQSFFCNKAPQSHILYLHILILYV